MLGDRLAVSAGLIDNDDPGRRAGIDVDGVGAGTIG